MAVPVLLSVGSRVAEVHPGGTPDILVDIFESGQAAADAIRGAVPHVARALITTSVALSLGFLSLLVSPWQSVANFGALAAAAIMLALLADLLVLPALILLLARIPRPHRNV